MRTNARPVRIEKSRYGRAALEALEGRILLSGVMGAAHSLATSTPVPAFTGTMSPGDTTSPGPVLTTLRPTLEWTTTATPAGVSGIQINLFDQTRSKMRTFRVGATADQFTLPSGSLTEGDSYVWNLRYVDGNRQGTPGAYLFFQAPPVPPLPAPVIVTPGSATSPGPVLTTLTPTFTWHAVTGVSGMTGYTLSLQDTTTGTGTTYSIGKSKTNFTLPAGVLVAGDAYVWNLRIVAGSRAAMPSSYFYFQAPPVTTTPTVPAPVIVAPGSSTSPGPVLTTTTPTFQWQAVTGVAGMTGYRLNLYDVTAGKGTTYTAGADATSYTLPSGVLVAGDTYVWNLRVMLGATATGPESAYFYFQAPPAAAALPTPVITSPGSATSPRPVLTTNTPTFTWQAVTGISAMTGYQLTLYDTTSSKSTTYKLGADATSYTLPAGVLVAGDDYVWNLRVVAGSQSGPPSAYFMFQAPAATTTTVPAPVITEPGSATSPGPVLSTLTPTLRWTALTGVAGRTGYQINLYDATTKVMVSYRVGADATSYTLPSGALRQGDDYVWNLRAVLGNTTGPESNYLYFQA